MRFIVPKVVGGICTGFGIFLVVKAVSYGIGGPALGIAVFTLAVGAVILILGFLGCCGAWKESACFLKMVNR